MPHSPYFGPGLLATLHLAAILQPETMIEYSFADLGANPLGDCILMRQGRIDIPSGPGLGCDPDLDILHEFRVP
jgi:L-alanine-DL-glutamate epimerase-like enolase superfamily enzyme